MKKSFLFIVSGIFFASAVYCQTGFTENFNDGNLSGWTGSADYGLTNTGNELRVDVHKTSTWSSFSFSFDSTDISSNPYVRIRIKSDVDINLNFFINTDQSYGNDGTPREIIHSEGYTEYIFDFSQGKPADLGGAKLLTFVCNPGGAQGCNATLYIDDIRMGTDAPAMPSISRIPDQFHGINASEITVPFWGVKDMVTGANPIAITASSSNTGLIPDPVVYYTSPNKGDTLVYTPVANQAGTAVITVTVAGNAPENNVMQFKVTVEANKAPKINQIANLNVQNGVVTRVAFSGLDDGDPYASQNLIITAASSNINILPNPVIVYSQGDFGGTLKLSPIAGQTGPATVTVKVKDGGGIIAGGVDTLIMQFDVMVYSEINNAPALNELSDISVLEGDPEQVVHLRGITDGDVDAVQGIIITAESSDPSLIPDPAIIYTSGAGSGELHFTPVPGKTGNAVITVLLSDDGGNASNNGNASAMYTFEVEVRAKPIAGWEDDFNDGVLGPEWPADWGDPGEDSHLCSEHDGYMEIQVNKSRSNNVWAGLWFNIPSELDMSNNPYISIVMKTDEAPKEMLIFLWDAYDHYNTGSTVKKTVTGDFTEYFFDYSKPADQLQGDGTPLDMSRIKALLINFAPGAMYNGKFYFDDFRVGDKAHRQAVTPTVTMAVIPDLAIPVNAPLQEIKILNLTDGASGANAVTINAVSNNTSLIPNPTASAVTGGMSTLNFNPVAGMTGTATITVTGTATGSHNVVKTFKVIVSALDEASAADVTIDLNTTYQEIDGFGAFMGSGEIHPDTIISLAKDMGMSMARFGLIGGGFEEVNDNSDPYVVNLDGFRPDALSLSNMRRIAPFVDKFILTVWSPAGWMKFNKWENGVESWSTNNKLDPRYYQEYAEEVVALVRIVKRETGKDIYAIGLQNEPQFNEPYPSCQVNENEFRDIIKVVGARLDAEGLGEVKLYWAEALPAQNSIQSYINAVKADPLARGYADIVAIHNYDADGASVGGAGCEQWQDIYSWAQAGGSHNKTWMTETSGHSDDWNGAMILAGNIFNALSCGNVSAWDFWSFAVDPGSATEGLVVGNRPSARYYVSKQFYKFIRPGAVRVSATSAGIPALAFKDESAKTVSIILFNNTSQAQTIEIKGEGLPTTWESYTTSNGRNCEAGAFVAEDGLLVVPPSSITTLTGNTSNPVPTLDNLANMVIDVNSGEQSLQLSGISDGVGFDQNILIDATSSNTNLIENPVVSYVNGQSTGTLTFTPAADMTGITNITVTLTDNGEPVGTRSVTFSVSVAAPTGLNNPLAGEISLWPNPVKESLRVNTSDNNFTVYSILSAQGVVIDGGPVTKHQFDINTSGLPGGVYFLLLKGNNQNISIKFIK
jgi:glucuronoarabinoxylan endo-1,4-beta-xylanase